MLKSKKAQIASLRQWAKYRRRHGLPEPTEHDRKLRRARNERYQAKLRERQQQEGKAA